MGDSDATATPTTLREELRGLVGPGSRDLWLIYLATFLEYLGYWSFLQTLSFWLSDIGLDDEAAGWVATGFSLLITLLSFFAGALADTFGVRRLLIASFVVAAVTRLGMPWADGRASAVAWVMAYAFGFALTSPALQVAVNLASRPATRAFAFSLWYVSFNLAGAVVGVPIDWIRGRFLEDGKLVHRLIDLPLLGPREVSAHAVILACGFVSAALAALVVLFVRRDLGHETASSQPTSSNPFKTVRDVVVERRFWQFMLLMMLLSLVRLMFQHMHFTWPKYVTRVEGETFPVGRVWSLNSIGIIFLVPLTTALTRRLPIFPVLLVGATISALSPFLLCFGSAIWIQVAMIAVLTVGEALWSPRLYEYNVAIAPPGQEATYVGLAKLPFFLAKLIVTPMSGWLLASYCPADGPRDPALLWAIVGASTLAGPLGMWLLQGWLTGGKSDPARA